jgi:hypothetical protein
LQHDFNLHNTQILKKKNIPRSRSKRKDAAEEGRRGDKGTENLQGSKVPQSEFAHGCGQVWTQMGCEDEALESPPTAPLSRVSSWLGLQQIPSPDAPIAQALVIHHTVHKNPSYIMISIHQPERLQSENERTGTSHVRPAESQMIPRDAQIQNLIPGKDWIDGSRGRRLELTPAS